MPPETTTDIVYPKNNIVNAERRGKRQVLIRPSSKVVVKFLSVMQRHGEHHFRGTLVCFLHSVRSDNYDWCDIAPRACRFNAPKYELSLLTK